MCFPINHHSMYKMGFFPFSRAKSHNNHHLPSTMPEATSMGGPRYVSIKLINPCKNAKSSANGNRSSKSCMRLIMILNLSEVLDNGFLSVLGTQLVKLNISCARPPNSSPRFAGIHDQDGMTNKIASCAVADRVQHGFHLAGLQSGIQVDDQQQRMVEFNEFICEFGHLTPLVAVWI